MFAKMEKQLSAALPKFMTPERMIRVATTTVQKVPKLLECAPVTVVGATMQAAALGLEPDNVTGSAYLVPFWNSKMRRLECTLVPGYRGLMALARRSKEIAAFDARVVKVGDAFEYEYGTRQFLRHKPAGAALEHDKTTGKFLPARGGDPETSHAYMIAFYNSARLSDGNPLSQFTVLNRAELERIKQHTNSRNKDQEIVGPWIEHEDAMFTKSVIRRGAKLLPFSIELMTAVGLDERAIAGKSQNLGALVADDLGINFATSDDDEPEPSGQNGDAPPEQIDPELVKKLDVGFGALGYREAQKTAKMQEFRGRLPELVLWLDAEVAKGAKSAGEGSTPAASGSSSSNESAKPEVRDAADGNGKKTQPSAGWRI